MHSKRQAYPDSYRDTGQMPSTLVELLQRRALNQPDFPGYTFLVDAETKEANLTHGELHKQACAIAALLQSAVMAGERALMLFPPGLDFLAAFFGCLYSQVVAVPAYPPDRARLNRTLPRLRAIISDAQAKVVLTTSPILSLAEPLFAHAPDLANLKWLATDNVGAAAGEGFEPLAAHPDMLAFLQYTSGSTGAPKGVMLSHANLLHNASMLHYAFSHTANDKYVSWLPTFHDMGFMVGILQPLYAGIPAVLLSPVSFLQDPIRWLRAISRYKATTSGAPNFAYDLCARKITPEQRATLDLSSWSVAFNGSEPVRADTLDRFAATFESCGFRKQALFPCYGLAEATLIVSGGHKHELPIVKTFGASALDEDDNNGKRMVSCGQHLLEEKIRIVDPESLIECSEDEEGEVWVSSPSVARGYWNRPQETHQTFAAHIMDTREGPFLRTGDLGFLKEEELFVTGRRKDLIIIRGQNHYPQDIEYTVERCHPALKPGCGAAFSIDEAGEERLVVVQEVDDKQPFADSDIEGICRAIAHEHEIQAYAVVLIKPKSIHKTSSGKIQRRACRNDFLAGKLDVVTEWRLPAISEQVIFTPADALQSKESIESFLVSYLASTLGLRPADINIDLPISRYALDSLAAIELAHGIEKQLGIVVPMVDLLQELSIAQLSAQAFTKLASPAAVPKAGIDSVDESAEGFPLSYGQRALWFLYQIAPESSAYNIANAVRIRAELDTVALRSAFQILVNRHPSLRTTFSAPDGEPFQRVNDFLEVSFSAEDVSAWDETLLDERIVAESHRPFDLERDPLLRITLFKQSALEHIMLLVVHHIAVDFWSLGVLLHELGELYEAEKNGASAALAPLTLQYTDYVHWQAERLTGTEGEQMWAYWRAQLAGDLPTLNLPTDRPRPSVQTYCGASQTFKLGEEMTDGLKALARAHGATLYSTLLAAFQVLLYRYSGEEDIWVGSPTAGRTQAEFSNVVGYFVNPVILRADVSSDPTFNTFLDDVRQTVLSALTYQDYPFNLLVERLQPERDPSMAPLFQVMFVLHKVPLLNEQGLSSFALGEGGAKIQLGSLALESLPSQQRVAQFDLTLAMAEGEGGLAGSLEYNTDLFDASTISRMIENFKCLLGSVLADPGRQVSQLPLLTESERRLLMGWNQPQTDYPDDQCIHQFFEAQAEANPEAVALIFEDTRMSYKELNRRANQLAHHLRALGVTPEVGVGVCSKQPLKMVVSLLATLKAGGVYVPLDPQYPSKRLAFMIYDSEVRVLLTEQQIATQLPAAALPQEVVCLDSDWDVIAHESDVNPRNLTEPDNLAYVIYTSGSTGTPKGVSIAHRAAVNHFFVIKGEFELRPSDVVLQFSSFSFDVSLEEIFPALFTGASVVLRGAEAWTTADFIHNISELGLTVLDLTTAYWHQLIKDCAANEEKIPNNNLRVVLAGGDTMLPEPVRLWQQSQLSSTRLINGYGPTETTITATGFDIPPRFFEEATQRKIPIGRPLENRTMYVLDRRGNLAPLGVAGELHIGGNLIARGYLNRPDLTAERFIPDHFSDQPGARLYKTGDLTRYLADGNIEFLGRIDQQVKVRGFRIELGEVEAVLDQNTAVRECIVKAREDKPGDKRLVAYVAAAEGETLTVNELRGFMKERLPDYMVPAAFVLLEALPLTPNGKVDHRQLPPPDWAGSELAESFTVPRTPVEEILAGVWSKVLGVERVSTHSNFFDLGGHSLLATQVVSRLRKVLQIEMPLRTLFEHPTIAALAENIETVQKTEQKACSPEILPVAEKDDLPLSFAQQRLWFLEQFEPGNYAYNMPGAMRLTGRLDAAALERSFNEIVRRHEALRTTFKLKNGEPVQVVSPALTLTLDVQDLSTKAESEREAIAFDLASREAVRPFDLARGPLIRVNLLRLAEEDHLLVITLHHIICDGWSLGVLLRELTELYGAYLQSKPSPLPEPVIQYADFAHWQREWLQGEVLDNQFAYWRNQLSGELPILNLMTDRPRPAVLTYNGAKQSVEISKDITESLKALSRRHEVTLFMTLLAAFKTLLYRFTGQKDIIAGSTIANRNRAETEGLIGFFVNTLVLRTDLSGGPTFQELLARVREVTLGAYAHQDLPFEKLVEELQPERHISINPLFQVMFALQNAPMPDFKLPGLTLSYQGIENYSAKFDIMFDMLETADGLQGFVEYNTDLFDSSTIERLASHFITLLEAVVADPDRAISELSILSPQERRQLLIEWNNTQSVYPESECIHRLFEIQAERQPESIAVTYDGRELSYGELNQSANQLAHHLISFGVGPEVIVGVYLDRSPDMIVSLLAILKAGGAYLPLDSYYPKPRIAFMIDDARVPVLLTRKSMLDELPQQAVTAICVDSDWAAIATNSQQNPSSQVTSDNLAYVIYTSGSTGKPKGVAIEHHSTVAMLDWARRLYSPDELRAVLASTSVCFDLSIYEIFLPLVTGGCILLVEDALELLGGGAGADASLINTVPSAIVELVRGGWQPKSEVTVNLAGEALKRGVVDMVYGTGGVKRVVNLYGPTECTTYSSYEEEAGGVAREPGIGRPISNTTMYIVGEGMEPVAVGVAGDLYIGGEGVARGYYNKGDYTADRFVPDPFSLQPGSRLYKTGDLARFNPDGSIQYLGRNDFQVKLRGFRIELGDIESLLNNHPAVAQAVVIMREDSPGDQRLVAYYVTNPGATVSASELKAVVKEKLPQYMVPSAFVPMAEMVLTPNGKVDRKALPNLEGVGSQLSQDFDMPRTPTEGAIAAIWSEVLRSSQVGRLDNFFELGGHSLLATQVISRIREDFQLEIPVRSLFTSPTIAGLASIIEQKQLDETGSEKLVEMLADLDQLSDEEVEALLASEEEIDDKGI